MTTKLKPQPLKRAVVKEELVILTGDFKKAIILNQFLYWSQRVKDFDKFITEEKERAEQPVGIYSYRYLRYFFQQATQLLAAKEEQSYDQQIEQLCQRIIK